MKLQECMALVTGGAVRIGRAICEALATEGCGVIVHCNNSIKEAEELAKQIRTTNARAHVVRGDLTSRQKCRDIVDEAWRKEGRLDILINNAGVFHKDSLISATDEEFLAQIAINFQAPAWLTFAFSKKIKDKSHGAAIVNLLDRRIMSPGDDCLPYVVSKKMLAEFTRTSAMELAPTITVNAVAPGAVLPPPRKSGEYVKDMAGNVPLGIKCTPADVAAAVVFLLKSKGITGQTIFVDGGQHFVI